MLDGKLIPATAIGDDWAAKDGGDIITVTPEMRENADASGAIRLADGRTITFLKTVHPHIAYVEIDPDILWDDVEREAGRKLDLTSVEKASAVEESAGVMLENNGYERLVMEVVEGLLETV
ncbi:MAG: hypothetical protein QXE52_08020 [Candidatus Caldarchaeum sp.]